MTVALATTSLRQFWPQGQPLYLLGRWCVPDGRELGPNYILQNYPWDETARFRSAYQYTTNVYENRLGQLAEALNRILGVPRSVEEWRIIVGPWLMFYVHALYDRYACLKQFIDQHHDIETLGLHPNSFQLLNDFSTSSADLFLGELYNLQLISQILKGMGVTMIERDMVVGAQPRSLSIFQGAKSILKDGHRAICRRGEVVIVGAGIPYSETVKLGLKSGGRITACGSQQDIRGMATKPNSQQRIQLAQELSAEDEFGRILNETIAKNMPLLYLENFAAVQKKYIVGRRTPRVCIGGSSW